MKDKPEQVRARMTGRNAKLEESGLEQVSVWIPKGRKSEVWELAKSLRLAAGVSMPKDRSE